MSNLTAYIHAQHRDDNEIIGKYAHLVKKIAYHLMGRLPQKIQVDDLIQAGMMGLLEASRKYDPTKGASFETYAGIRIRGTMLDDVRKNDWLPRSIYKNSRMISEAISKVEHREGRDARSKEIADELNLSHDEYHKLLREVNSGQLYGFEDIGLDENKFQHEVLSHGDDPFDEIIYQDFCETLADALEKLPERERLVLSLYYDEELNLKEIGEILEVSESRVCQIHSQAMHRMKSRIPQWKQK